METIITIILVVGVIGLILYRIFSKEKEKKDNHPPDLQGLTLKIISPNYLLFVSPYWQELIDMVARYGNAIRVFVYGDWGEGGIPWHGNNMADLRQDMLENMQKIIKYANDKGLWVILSMFQDNAGGGTEDVINRDRGQLKNYIKQIVEKTQDFDVIYETTNEINNNDFQGFVLNELKVNNVQHTCTYESSIGANYDNHHRASKNYEGQQGWIGYIQSSDSPNFYRSGSPADIISLFHTARERGGHFELLTSWKMENWGGGGGMEKAAEQEAYWKSVFEGI